jgi:hypothetical protein
MKKLFSVIAGLALFSGSQAFAWVGGPFDNGDYSATLDNEGIYQATFRMKNGTGFAQFGTNVDLFASTSSGDAGGSSTDLTNGSYLNRSLIYYKGITYFGSATGTVDMERRRIDGITNGYTEASATSTTSSDSGTVSASQTIVFNGGRGFSCNSMWIAKITQTYPVLKFNGSGEFTALPQDLSALLTNLAVTIVENNDSTSLSDLPALGDYLASLTETGAETVHMKVFGSRKFFLGRR